MICSDAQKFNVISLYSSAGSGFEDYCNRVTLINDNDLDDLGNVIHRWKEDEQYLEAQIKLRFNYLFKL